jgi:hypothetical protein
MKRYLSYALPFLTVGMLVGCAATPISVRMADPTAANEAYTFKTKPGLAKVYFVGGTLGTVITPSALKPSITGGAVFFIDGNRVGQIDKNDVLVVDVVPKQYNFSWQYPANDQQTQFVNRQLNAGDIVILQGNSIMPVLGGFGGPFKYELLEQADRSLVMGKRVVSHTSCPATICK